MQQRQAGRQSDGLRDTMTKFNQVQQPESAPPANLVADSSTILLLLLLLFLVSSLILQCASVEEIFAIATGEDF